MESKLFGSSGVRGLVNVDLTPSLMVRIGSAVATFSRAKKAVVARDTRVSGLMLENALVSGLLAGGADVNCLGMMPTPVLAYLTKELKADVGLMITASHNPPQYNGIKIFSSNSMAYNEKSQKEVEEIVKNSSFKLASWQNIHEATSIDEDHRYVEMIQRTAKLRKKWRIILDAGCGATCSIAPTIFESLGCKLTAMNAQPDGFFPARNPEPNSESLQALSKIVKELGADAGIAYDGDGDRVAFIDDGGNFVDFDRVLAVYTAHFLKVKGKGIVVTNAEASMCFEKMVEPRGGKVIRTKVGDVYLAEAMRMHNAIFGGEPCGAWIHPQFHYCPDGILSSVMLLKALEEADQSLSEFVGETPQYPTIRENVTCRNEVKYDVVKKFRRGFKTVFSTYKDFSNVDGVRLALENGWILVRASGTEPLLRLTVEGESLKVAEEIMKSGKTLVKRLVREAEK